MSKTAQILETKRANELAKKLEIATKRLVALEEINKKLEFELTVNKAGVAFSEQARKEDAVMYESRIRELGGESIK